jgi:hypothetical protein
MVSKKCECCGETFQVKESCASHKAMCLRCSLLQRAYSERKFDLGGARYDIGKEHGHYEHDKEPR